MIIQLTFPIHWSSYLISFQSSLKNTNLPYRELQLAKRRNMGIVIVDYVSAFLRHIYTTGSTYSVYEPAYATHIMWYPQNKINWMEIQKSSK